MITYQLRVRSHNVRNDKTGVISLLQGKTLPTKSDHIDVDYVVNTWISTDNESNLPNFTISFQHNGTFGDIVSIPISIEKWIDVKILQRRIKGGLYAIEYHASNQKGMAINANPQYFDDIWIHGSDAWSVNANATVKNFKICTQGKQNPQLVLNISELYKIIVTCFGVNILHLFSYKFGQIAI